MNHPLIYSFTHQLIRSFTHTILSIYAIAKNSPRIFAFSACSAVRKIGQPDKKMQNEPNPVLSEVEWIKPITHLINEQFTNEPNLHRGKITHLINEQRTMNNCQTNPIYPPINVTSVMTKYYNNEQRTIPALSSVEGNNEQLSNEPNFKPAALELSNEP